MVTISRWRVVRCHMAGALGVLGRLLRIAVRSVGRWHIHWRRSAFRSISASINYRARLASDVGIDELPCVRVCEKRVLASRATC